MQRTGDTSTFDGLNDASCHSCATFEKSIIHIYAAGGHVEAKPTHINWVRRSLAVKYGAEVSYRVRETAGPSRYQEKSGGSWKYLAGGTDTQILYLRRSSGAWQVVEYAQLAGSAS